MKNAKFLMLSLLTVMILGVGCRKEILPLGDAPSKVEGIQGSWKLTKVEQRDNKTICDEKKRDVSALVLGGSNPMVISFTDNTYTYSLNATYDFFGFGTSGTWAFGNDDFPTLADQFPEYVNFNDNVNIKKLALSKTVRPQDQELVLTIWTTLFNNKDAIGYEYTFVRQ